MDEDGPRVGVSAVAPLQLCAVVHTYERAALGPGQTGVPDMRTTILDLANRCQLRRSKADKAKDSQREAEKKTIEHLQHTASEAARGPGPVGADRGSPKRKPVVQG